MTERIEIPRRTLLGALGAVGVGSAAGGLGTSAFFSDEEQFENNRLVAGELDLKVDWTEHYSDWSDDEGTGVTVSMTDDSLPFGFPSAADDKLLYVDDYLQFLANTAIEAYPDVDPRGPEPTDAAAYDGRKFGLLDDDICDQPADLDEVLSSPYRTGGVAPTTVGGAPNAQTTKAGDPLVNIEDVKPGDFGEVTFSFHVCGNPGYVWLTGGLADADENGTNEPESKDPDEFGVGDPDDPDPSELFDNEGDEDPEPDGPTRQERVELLDAMKAAVWYDHGSDGVYGADPGDKDSDGSEGDNYRQPEEGFVAGTGSLRNVLRALEGNLLRLSPDPGAGGSGTGTGGGGSGGTSTFPEGTVSNAIKDSDGNVLTNDDFEDFQANSNVDCDRLAKGLVDEGFLDEEPSWVETKIDDVDQNGLQIGPVTGGMCPFTIDAEDWRNGTVTISAEGPIGAVVIKGGGGNQFVGSNFYVWDEPVRLSGVQFSTPLGQEISNIKMCCPVDGGNGGPGLEIPGECFPNSTTAYIGFEWWLPVDHANEIQSDSVAFDLGFYTEQCRHNDGTNPQPEGS